MKNISVLATFAVFTIVAMVGSVMVSGSAGPGATVESITSAIMVPAAQQLPAVLAQN